jgi:hypothetical protein
MDTGDRQRKQLDSYADPLSPNDPELAAKVRAKIGAPYRDLVDPSVAAFVNPGHSYSLLGVNSHRVPDDKRDDFALRMSMGLGQINANSYNDFLNPKKHVYGIGNGASPQTMGHEYRHDKIKDESANRLMDLVHSNSRAQYTNSLQSLYEDLYGKKDENMALKDKEKKVMDVMSLSLSDMGLHNNLLNTHADINRGESQGYMAHPIEYLTGDTQETSAGKLPKTVVSQRSQFPFLNFIGGDLPTQKATTLPENYRKGGRVRMI